MECGRVKFSLKQLLRLANLFDCQLECFFDPRQAANVAVGGTGRISGIPKVIWSCC